MFLTDMENEGKMNFFSSYLWRHIFYRKHLHLRLVKDVRELSAKFNGCMFIIIANTHAYDYTLCNKNKNYDV